MRWAHVRENPNIIFHGNTFFQSRVFFYEKWTNKHN